MTKEIEEALKNIQVVTGEFRGTVNGQTLCATEHIAVANSFRNIIEELKRLYSIEEACKNGTVAKEKVELPNKD